MKNEKGIYESNDRAARVPICDHSVKNNGRTMRSIDPSIERA